MAVTGSRATPRPRHKGPTMSAMPGFAAIGQRNDDQLAGRTMDVIQDRQDDADTLVEPQETMRIEQPPGARALKLLHAMHAAAGTRLADDTEHRCELADLSGKHGLRRLTVTELEQALGELTAVGILRRRIDHRGRGRIATGSLIDYAKVDIHDHQGTSMRWRFGTMLREIARESRYWTMLERPVVMAMRSRYAIALLEHISAHAWMKDKRQTLDINELRQALGVPEGRLHGDFRALRKRALDPAIAEINTLSQFHVSYTIQRSNARGRPAVAVTLSWTRANGDDDHNEGAAKHDDS